MTTLLRIQRRRVKGWRLPPNTRCVDRTTEFGNRYMIGERIEHVDGKTYLVADAGMAVRLHREWLYWQMDKFKTMRDGLRHDLGGHNLACFCRLCPDHAAGKPLGVSCTTCAPCHADTYLEAANQ